MVKKLFAVRWMGQFTDGIFQTALASFVLFSPERQPNAVSAAIAFSVVLLPYSIVGPFVGTILDRISRQRVIFMANLFRAFILIFIATLIRNGITGIELTVFVLIAFGVNRLILAGLSAGLPLLVERKKLVTFNAVAVTGGTVFVVIGGGVGIALRNFLDSKFSANSADSLLITVAAAAYFIASLLVLRLPRVAIGPKPHEIKRNGLKDQIVEMRDGFKLLWRIRDCLLGITATGVQRGGITALTLMALLLERNSFNNPNDPEAGLAGFAVAVVAAGVGITIGAVITPLGVAKYGRHLWIRSMLIASAVLPLLLAISQQEYVLIITGFAIGLFGQSLKVTNDALVQSQISDEFRGRVFAVYDVMVNAGIVSGAILAALTLSKNGSGWLLPLLISIIYLLVALYLLKPKNFHAEKRSTN